MIVYPAGRTWILQGRAIVCSVEAFARPPRRYLIQTPSIRLTGTGKSPRWISCRECGCYAGPKLARVPDMDVLDTARSHGVRLDAKSNIEISDQPSSSESFIIASEAQPDGEFSQQHGTAVDSSSTGQARKFVATNGLSFSRYAFHTANYFSGHL